jgi:hypothetical protein
MIGTAAGGMSPRKCSISKGTANTTDIEVADSEVAKADDSGEVDLGHFVSPFYHAGSFSERLTSARVHEHTVQYQMQIREISSQMPQIS